MLRRLLAALFAVCLLFAVAVYVLLIFPVRNPHPAPFLAHGTLVIRDARVYPDPDSAPLDHATILIRDGRIVSVSTGLTTPPPDATIVPCNACTVTAGFWNNHVHFTQIKWLGAEWKSAATLNPQLADMLTSRGFTTVVDTGSDLRNTIPLRRRIESGELLGPFIYTAGAALYPPHGLPFYLRETLPRPLQLFMPQPDNPAEAVRDVRHNIKEGADILKLFTGSYVQRDTVLPMPIPIATAAAAEAHAHGQLVFAHPSDLAGVQVAASSGVDVLAHAPDTTEGITPELLQSLVDRHTSMVPTLKMFATTVTTRSSYLDPIYAVVREFHIRGGQLLFGTDVGYMTDYSTRDEFLALGKSGLNAQDILRMLTTAPAARFGVSASKGRVAPGQLADLVLLSADPAHDLAAFASVQTTIRSGRVVYTNTR